MDTAEYSNLGPEGYGDLDSFSVQSDTFEPTLSLYAAGNDVMNSFVTLSSAANICDNITGTDSNTNTNTNTNNNSRGVGRGKHLATPAWMMK